MESLWEPFKNEIVTVFFFLLKQGPKILSGFGSEDMLLELRVEGSKFRLETSYTIQ